MKRTRVNPRNPRTTALKKFISQRHAEVIERDVNTTYNGERVGNHCLFYFTPIECNSEPRQVHEIIARGKSRREAQLKWFVDENQCCICYNCETLAQTKNGRDMLQSAMTRIFGFSYDEKGYWERYYDDNEKGIV